MRHLFVLSLAVFLSGCVSSGLGTKPSPQITHAPSISSEVKEANVGYFKVGNPYKVAGKTYVPKETYDFTQTGIASWYGPQFHGKQTANGEVFDMNDLTAAHKTLQLPSVIRVTNLENGRSIVVRVNDRGPFKRGRILDLSKRAAELLHFKDQGTARIKIQLLPEESRQIASLARDGRPTHGIELASLNGRAPQREEEITPVTIASAPTALAAPLSTIQAQPLDPIVPNSTTPSSFQQHEPVQHFAVPTTQIYVQAGSFSAQENAARYAQSLSHFGKADVYPAQINGQQFYRVRFGPMQNVQQADTVLASLANAGRNDAIIVVD